MQVPVHIFIDRVDFEHLLQLLVIIFDLDCVYCVVRKMDIHEGGFGPSPHIVPHKSVSSAQCCLRLVKLLIAVLLTGLFLPGCACFDCEFFEFVVFVEAPQVLVRNGIHTHILFLQFSALVG